MENLEILFESSIKPYEHIDQIYTEIEQDINNLREYEEHLQISKKRGFKVDIAIERLGYQIQLKEISLDVLKRRREDIILLYKNDMLELTKILVQHTPTIDNSDISYVGEISDVDDETANLEHLTVMKNISLKMLEGLNNDCEKFNDEITLAKHKDSLGYDLGDLCFTLSLQRDITFKKKTQYEEFYEQIFQKHLNRSTQFLDELKKEGDDILNDIIEK